MKTGVGVKIGVGIVGVVLLGRIYFGYRTHRRSRITSLLLQALQTRLPSTNALVAEQAFDIEYASKVLNSVPARIIVLDQSAALEKARRLQLAFKPWYRGGDDEKAVYSVLRSLSDKVQLSQVAKAYQDQYGESLLETIKAHLDAAEIKTVLTIVGSLPRYRKR